MKASYLLLFLTSCDSPELEVRGEHQSTATVQLNPSFFLPRSDRFLPNQIALLTSCDSREPKARGAYQSTATVEFLQVTSRNDSHDFVASQITIAESEAVITGAGKPVELPAKTISDSLEFTLIADNDLVTISAHHDNKALPEKLAIFVKNYHIQHFDDLESLPRTEQEMFHNARHKLGNFEVLRDQLEIQIERFTDSSYKDINHSWLSPDTLTYGVIH